MSSEAHPRFYRSSRTKVIATVLLGIGALGGAGMLAGALVPEGERPALQGSSLGDQGSGPAPSFQPRSALPQVTPSATATPSAVPSVAPSTAPSPSAPAPSASASSSPSAPTPSPSSTGGVTSSPTYLVNGTIEVSLPPPWEAYGESGDGKGVYFMNGQGDWAFVKAAQVLNLDEELRNAEALIPLTIDNFVDPEYYTQSTVSEVELQEPFGDLVSLGSAGYEALYVDSQSTAEIFGTYWLGIRSDGQSIAITAESSPAAHFSDEAWRELVESAVNSFAYPNG